MFIVGHSSYSPSPTSFAVYRIVEISLPSMLERLVNRNSFSCHLTIGEFLFAYASPPITNLNLPCPLKVSEPLYRQASALLYCLVAHGATIEFGPGPKIKSSGILVPL